MLKILLMYRFEVIVILLQLTGIFSVVGIMLGVVLVFYKVAISKRIDVFSIFLLFMPSIVLRGAGVDYSFYDKIVSGWVSVLIPSLNDVFLVGPIAVSIPLFASVAVPFRLLKMGELFSGKLLYAIWLLSLLIAVYGLFLAIDNGLESAGGLTVGLRIVLSIGAVLIPLSVDEKLFENELRLIFRFSIILFLLGLLNNHWLFIAAAFPALLIFSENNKGWQWLGVAAFFIMIYFPFTFTVKITALLSFIMLFLRDNRYLSIIYRIRGMKYLILLFPLFVMFFIVFYPRAFVVNSDYDIIKSFFFKLYDDRGYIWRFSVEYILKSDFFFVPAGRDIPLLDLNNPNLEWGAGAHNIYLEMSRQLGLFVTLMLFGIISFYLISLYKQKKNSSYLSKVQYALLVSYMVYGLTGNSLVYTGVGFVFWLIIGQMYRVNLIEKNQSY